MTQTLTITQELAQLDSVLQLDPAVIRALPKDVTFVSAEHFGTSAWSTTGRLVGLDRDNTERQYFIKIASGEPGRLMLHGEYESAKAIYEKQPDSIPEPVGFGKYDVLHPETYFFLMEFVDMDVHTPPEAAEFTSRLAELHKVSKSPTGKFGFHIQTCDGSGDRPHIVEWEESWTVFYKKLLLGVCKLDLERNGPWPEFERALDQVVSKVIPRLLDPLRSDGSVIKPCLIHGNLYEGNMGINLETGDTLLFDPSSYYAHNEMELGHWRCEFSSVFRSKLYTRHYLRNYPAAEPTTEFDDRNRLYSLKGAINYSAGHYGSSLRKTAYNNMCYLCEKYAPIDGIDKYDPKIDPSITAATIVPHSHENII
ncbi:Fructosamine kinase-domain-containing protein [Xylariaceae sp. FL0255]|nr:Fructosamine kinase-domain-containing protein [Xylariaceae sp. FL0255]